MSDRQPDPETPSQPSLAEELVERHVAMIAALDGGPSALAAQAAYFEDIGEIDRVVEIDLDFDRFRERASDLDRLDLRSSNRHRSKSVDE